VLELSLLMLLCAAGTYVWRGLGVLLADRIDSGSELFAWITCVAYAMVAGLIMRIIVMPTGLLATSLLAHRVIACTLGLAAYYFARRNLFVAVCSGAVALTVLNYLRGVAG
jgi:branched-subunit amino acid transport protein